MAFAFPAIVLVLAATAAQATPAHTIDLAASGTLLAGWTTTIPCAVDTPDRVFANTTFGYLANNTPQACAQYCAAAGYTMAGVEAINQCFCGNGWLSEVPPTAAPVSQCSNPCGGDSSQTCGGSWAIQTYALTSLPAGWTETMPCAVDTPHRVFAYTTYIGLENNTPRACAQYCAAAGYTMAGVEGGNQCFCGNGWTTPSIPPTAAPVSQCSNPCAGDSSQTCGGSWAIQIYSHVGA